MKKETIASHKIEPNQTKIILKECVDTYSPEEGGDITSYEICISLPCLGTYEPAIVTCLDYEEALYRFHDVKADIHNLDEESI